MKMMLIAALIITLPALVLVIYGLAIHSNLVFPALASLCIGSLPFIVGALLLRGHDGGDEAGH
jgi:hypothetical protein